MNPKRDQEKGQVPEQENEPWRPSVPPGIVPGQDADGIQQHLDKDAKERAPHGDGQPVGQAQDLEILVGGQHLAKSDTSKLKEQIDQFNSLFTVDAKKDDVYDITYQPEVGSSLYINGNLKGTVEGFEFKKALFTIWFGNETELPKLRDAMLGK